MIVLILMLTSTLYTVIRILPVPWQIKADTSVCHDIYSIRFIDKTPLSTINNT